MTIVTFDEQGNAKEQEFTLPKLPQWTMAEQIGYEPKTTFWDDFSIADRFDPEAIADTFRRAFTEWRHDVEHIAELVLVLNHKGHWYYQASKQYDDDEELYQMSQLYFALFRKLDDWANENFTGDDADYYFNVTD